MKKKAWLYLFFATALLQLFAILTQINWLRNITKPLLITFLLVYFLQISKGLSSIKNYIVLALFFSWLGDVFLMLENKNSLYFIAGLCSFLTAHFLYIIFFLRARSQQTATPHWNIFVIIAASVYGAALFFFLNPTLGALQVPVLVYAIIICAMFVCSAHAFGKAYKTAAIFCIAGAVLFIASDSLLAINKFYQPFSAAGVLIMLTYVLAQFGIVYGSVQYLSSFKPAIKGDAIN